MTYEIFLDVHSINICLDLDLGRGFSINGKEFLISPGLTLTYRNGSHYYLISIQSDYVALSFEQLLFNSHCDFVKYLSRN